MDAYWNALPSHLWEEVYSQSKRSTLKTFRTGAVIFDKDHNILSKGCSHHSLSENTVHAEQDAISKSHKDEIHSCNILIATIGKAGNFAYSSRPCFSCVRLTHKYNLNKIYYAERLNDGTWIINKETPKELWIRGKEICNHTRFAKDMRIPN